MTALHIDFETRSTLDLKEVGLHRYARHKDTDVWCMAYAFSDEEPALLTGRDMRLDRGLHLVPMHVSNGGAVYAHNAPFELEIWNQICVPRYGWPELKPEQTFCTMAMCYAMGLPGALADAAPALGINTLKDTEGHALMLRMARPRKTSPLTWWDEPEKLERLYEYCRQDVRVERELHKRLMPLSAKERRVWLLDYKINQRGVQIDIESAKAAIALADKVKESYDEQISLATGGAVQAVTALIPLKAWLSANGCAGAESGLAKSDVVDLLAQPDLPAKCRSALTLRQEAGKASNAKFNAMIQRAGDDGRLRGMYQYHGAATGRWAGRAVQTHNLPRDMPKAEAVEKILALVREGRHDIIDAIYGAPLTVLSRCLRSFFVAPPGRKLVSGDFANIEGRMQAWFAGEDWKLKAFVAADNKTGPGLYELAYARMFNVPVESVANPSEERQIGKVSELAFGYQGGAGSFEKMGKNYNVRVAPAKADEFKEAWRAAHPRIKQTWYDLQRAALSAVRNPGSVFSAGHPARQARYKMVGSFLWNLLPSGRAICFPYPKILEDDFGPQLTYMSVPSQADDAGGKIIADPQNSPKWARVSTYGGALFNRVIQGSARDILIDACMLPLDEAGADFVMHTHDDGNIEVDDAKCEGARAAMEHIMRTPPEWAKGLPLYAECKVMSRYGK